MENNKSIDRINKAALILHHFIEFCEVMPDGTVRELRKRVDSVGSITIHIYSNEHPPPHFHVRYAGKSASFIISDCSVLKGSLGDKTHKKVKYWHKNVGKSMLEKVWNEMRPGDKVIGRSG